MHNINKVYFRFFIPTKGGVSMNLPEMFCDAAKKAFLDSHTKGTYDGIDVENGTCYILYTSPSGVREKMVWQEAASRWGGIYRNMTRGYN